MTQFRFPASRARSVIWRWPLSVSIGDGPSRALTVQSTHTFTILVLVQGTARLPHMAHAPDAFKELLVPVFTWCVYRSPFFSCRDRSHLQPFTSP